MVPVFFAQKKASDGNRRHVLTSETTKRKQYNVAEANVNKVHTNTRVVVQILELTIAIK